jgi:hypothetical protein
MKTSIHERQHQIIDEAIEGVRQACHNAIANGAQSETPYTHIAEAASLLNVDYLKWKKLEDSKSEIAH